MKIMPSGMREPENISALAALNIDIMAFSFKKDDPRSHQDDFPSRAGIIPDSSEDRLKKAGQDIERNNATKSRHHKGGNICRRHAAEHRNKNLQL